MSWYCLVVVVVVSNGFFAAVGEMEDSHFLAVFYFVVVAFVAFVVYDFDVNITFILNCCFVVVCIVAQGRSLD